METYDIYQLVDDLENIEDFLLDVISSEKKIRRYGLAVALQHKSYEKVSDTLSTLEAKLSSFSRTANIINPKLGTKFDEIMEESNISKASAEISVSIKIAKRSEDQYDPSEQVMRFFRTITMRYIGDIDASSPFLLGKSQIDIKGILIDIERITPILNTVRDEMYARVKQDFETFQPSNISIENVNVFVQNALSIISETDSLSADTKGHVEEYLKDIKAELARDTPAWKKIVGALVIVSAILSGLAAAPDALENVRDALNEILGTSIDEISPKPDYQPQRLPNFIVTNKPSDQDIEDV